MCAEKTQKAEPKPSEWKSAVSRGTLSCMGPCGRANLVTGTGSCPFGHRCFVAAIFESSDTLQPESIAVIDWKLI